MKDYEIIVRYEREGKVYYDEWFLRRDFEAKAIEDVKKEWHELNDHRFSKAKIAKFFIMVE